MRRRSALSAAISVLTIAALTTLAPPPAAARTEGAVQIWDVKDTTQAGQLTIYNEDGDGSLLGMPVGSGDLDGDGDDDVVLAPFYAPSGPGDARRGGGKLRIYFGAPGALSGATIDGASPPAGSVEVWGARGGDFLGSDVAVADVTGDGMADVLACAENADGFDTATNRSQAGALYIIPGRANWTSPMDMANANALGVTQILGARASDRLGFWAASGDVNGDGIGDVLVSADLAPGPSGPMVGALYVIPGRASFPSRIDLGDSGQLRSLGVTVVTGVDSMDHFGSSIASGDFDRDGLDDVAVSAGVSRGGAGFVDFGVSNGSLGQGGGDGPTNSRTDAGEVYVIYGRSSWPASIAMSSPPGDVGIYYGEDANGFFGEDLHAADVDGDGFAELGVGALLADAPGRANSGVGYIFWGAGLERGERLDVASLGGSNARVTRLYGERANDIGADSFLLADVDGDGKADVLFGSPNNTPAGRSIAGDLKVIYGAADPLPPVVDLANPPDTVPTFQILAADPGDMFTYSLAAGDVDGDGVLDLIPNAMGGDGAGNRHQQAGECYVISGKAFGDRTGRGGGEAGTPCVTRVEVTPDAKRYYAGQSGIELSVFCDSDDPTMHFEPGAVVVIRGVEVPTTFVSPTELHVRLDDAPDVRNTPGTLTVQAGNATSGLSAAVLSITLAGPTIRKAKAKSESGGFAIKLTGKNFLPGATVTLTNAAGDDVPVASVNRASAKMITAHVAAGAASRGETLTVRVVNPGPAPSAPADVRVP